MHHAGIRGERLGECRVGVKGVQQLLTLAGNILRKEIDCGLSSAWRAEKEGDGEGKLGEGRETVFARRADDGNRGKGDGVGWVGLPAGLRPYG